MSTALIKYKGDLQCSIQHVRSGSIINTDAPVDNHGKGSTFSPTDLLASALGSCMLTILASSLKEQANLLEGTEVAVNKIMSTDAPRRIVTLEVRFQFSKNLQFTDKQKEQAIRVIESCPVHKSLNPNINIVIDYQW
ncbi:MAG: OsmC family protein [Phycisphaerales bacterium]|nr:OsmC family protein [Phycisphaerales bacterium]